MRALALLVLLGMLAACGGGNDDSACRSNNAAGPYIGADFIAPVLITGEIAAPFIVTITARIEGLKDGGQQLVKIGYAGDAYEMATHKLDAGDIVNITLRHTFSGSETNYTPAYAYFGTLAILDHGAQRTRVTDVVVTACAVR